MRVGHDLDLDVAWALDVTLEEDGAVGERGGGLTRSGGDRFVELVRRRDNAHASATAAGAGLDQHGVADVGGQLRQLLGR